MRSTRLERWRRVTAAELRWRAIAAARTGVQALVSGLRTPRWHRSALATILSPAYADASLRLAVDAGDWQAAHDALWNQLRARRTRFVLDPAASTDVRRAVLRRWPGAAGDAARQADRILHGEYDVLGYRGLTFTGADGRVDWHLDPVHQRRAPQVFFARVPYLDPGCGDHKIIWEINRHQHWLRLGRAAWLTGDRRYTERMIDELEGWLRQNPPLVGINWASMLEIGFRAISWVWALHCLLGIDRRDTPQGPWLVDLLVGLERQIDHLAHNLSYYFSPNTHLTGEALALYVAGTALPELAASERWAATGRRILLDEIDRQILPDGGHAERSTHYQRYTLDFYLLALLTARRAGDAAAEARFADAAARLAEFTRAIATDGGRLPLIGDDDGGMLWPLTGRACNDVRDSLAVAAYALGRPALAPWGPPEEAAWIGGAAALARQHDAPPPPVASRAFTDTGYCVIRDHGGAHAVLDAGAHGYQNGGHAHADALSLTLSLDGRPLLVDPGTSTYTMDAALRDRMRSTAAHNTVLIDGRSQSVPSGPFHWRTHTDARLERWRHNPRFDWVQASHDGYAPLSHRRTVVRASGSGWLIADGIIGTGTHGAAAHWQFDAAWTVALDAGRVRATQADGARAWLLADGGDVSLHCGDDRHGLGWMAPAYGTLLPAPMARVVRTAAAPFALLFWIGDASWEQPALTRLTVDGDEGIAALAAQVKDGERTVVFLLRPGGTEPRRARPCRAGAYVTDARMLHYRCVGGRLQALDIADAVSLIPVGAGGLSIDADDTIGNLHVSVGDGILELQASTPPPPFRLQAAQAFHTIRLNGHEWPDPAYWRTSVSIDPSDWVARAADDEPARPWQPCGAAFADQ